MVVHCSLDFGGWPGDFGQLHYDYLDTGGSVYIKINGQDI